MKSIPVLEKPYAWLRSGGDTRFFILFGGASSGKSRTVALYLPAEKMFAQKNIGILVVRKTQPAVRKSCWRNVLAYCHKIKRNTNRQFISRQTPELMIRADNGSFVQFEGLDDVEKLKSIEGINYVWVEEATEITERDLIQLSLRARNANPYGLNQIILTFNPVDPAGNAWLKKLTDPVGDDKQEAEGEFLKHKTKVMRLTIDDNPLLPQAERDIVEALVDQDDEYYKIYRLGQWAMPTQIIYRRWAIVPEIPANVKGQRIWGLDYGYSTSPAALVEIVFAGENALYEREHLYRTNLTNPELIEFLKGVVPEGEQIVADSAEPKSNQELRNAGLNVIDAEKGPDSVQFGIRAVQAISTNVTADSANLIHEKRMYKWQTDNNGDVKSPAKPVKLHDHLMDAERYAISHVRGFVKAGIELVGAEDRRRADDYDPIFDEDSELFSEW